MYTPPDYYEVNGVKFTSRDGALDYIKYNILRTGETMIFTTVHKEHTSVAKADILDGTFDECFYPKD